MSLQMHLHHLLHKIAHPFRTEKSLRVTIGAHDKRPNRSPRTISLLPLSCVRNRLRHLRHRNPRPHGTSIKVLMPGQRKAAMRQGGHFSDPVPLPRLTAFSAPEAQEGRSAGTFGLTGRIHQAGKVSRPMKSINAFAGEAPCPAPFFRGFSQNSDGQCAIRSCERLNG